MPAPGLPRPRLRPPGRRPRRARLRPLRRPRRRPDRPHPARDRPGRADAGLIERAPATDLSGGRVDLPIATGERLPDRRSNRSGDRRHALGRVAHRVELAHRQLDDERRALADLRGDDDLAAVLADDLLRDGQAQAGPPRALGRGEDLEDRVDLAWRRCRRRCRRRPPGRSSTRRPRSVETVDPCRPRRPRRRRSRW